MNAYLEEVAPIIGIRESRRIMGEYVLTGNDVKQGRVLAKASVSGRTTLTSIVPTAVDSTPNRHCPTTYRSAR